MKTFYLTLTMIALLLLSTNAAQAQTTQPKLNQVELMKQFTGTWETIAGKDTTGFAEMKPYGTGFECSWKYITKGKITSEGKQLYGYDKKIDKFIYVNLEKGKDIDQIKAQWFISTNKYKVTYYNDIENPDKSSFNVEGEFKSPNSLTETWIKNGKPFHIDRWTRTK